MYSILDPMLNSKTSSIARLSQKASYIVILLPVKSRYIATLKLNVGLYNRLKKTQNYNFYTDIQTTVIGQVIQQFIFNLKLPIFIKIKNY